MKKAYLILFTILTYGITQAQEAVYTSGGNGSGSGGTIGYSIGQLAFNESSDGSFTISQGVQQPLEISNTLSVENFQNLNLKLLAYPNPTTDLLNLTFDNNAKNKLSYNLIDFSGRSIHKKNNLKPIETLDMKNLSNAIYYLNILEQNKIIKTFKIIKN